MTLKNIHINGKLLNKNKQPVAGLRIEAWDKDLFFDDFIAETTSNKDGSFQLVFTEARFNELFFDRRPDLYFKIFAEGKLIGTTEDSVVWNLDRAEEEVIITIDWKVDSTDDPDPDDDEDDTDTTTPDLTSEENLRKLRSLSGLNGLKKTIKDPELDHFFTTSNDQKTLLIDQWKEQEKLNESDVLALNNTIHLLRVTQSNADVLTAFSKQGIHASSDLIQYNADSLVSILQKENVTLSDQDLASYADDILMHVEAENPSAFFLQRIMEKPEWLVLDQALIPSPSEQFRSFYSNNKAFDLKNEPIISLETGQLNEKIQVSRPDPKLVQELSNAQQSLQLSNDTSMAALLFSKEVNIKKAANSSQQSLMRELNIDEENAMEIKRKAQYYHESAMNGYFAYRDIIANPYLNKTLTNLNPAKDEILGGLGKVSNWDKVKELNGLKDIDSIEELFGSQNYCECESCKSVLSPAAYFVDLMRFTEKRVLVHKPGGVDVKIMSDTHPIHLRTRRPDLWNLKLTCTNTNKRIPYVEIINEVLTSFINKHLGTGKSIVERLSQEKPSLEFSLPYNQHLDEVRVWLSYFKVTRLQILEYLYPSPDANERQLLALESLNLSKEQYAYITDQTPTGTIDTDVLEFRRKSGLSPEVTEQLVAMKFWTGKLAIVQVKDAGDIQKYHINFSSTLPGWKGSLHRLIRLWQLSGWTLKELDLIFQALDIQHDTLDSTAILNLASFKKIQQLLELDVPVLSGILKGFEQTNEDDSITTWKKLLPADWIANQTAHLEDLLANTDDDSFNLVMRLQGAFGLNAADILACLVLLKDKIGTPITPNGPVKIEFNTGNLNEIYRYVQLYKWTGVESFETFVHLLKVWGKGTVNYFVNVNEDIPAFAAFISAFKNNKISIDDLVYLFGDELKTTAVIEEDKTALTSAEMKTFIESAVFADGDKFQLFFNKWMGIDTAILGYYSHFMEVSEADLKALFINLAGSTTDDTYISFSNMKRRLERLQFLVDKFQIKTDDLKSIAEEAKTAVYPKLGFSVWQDMEWSKEFAYLGSWINETKTLRNFDLWLTLRTIETENVLPLAIQKSIAKWKKVDLAQVVNNVTKTNSITVIKNGWDRFDWAKKLNVSIELIDKLKTADTLEELETQSQLLRNAIRSKFESNESWEIAVQDLKNKLSSNKRDALCNFVIFNGELRGMDFDFNDREDLYRYFLLDVDMGDCFTLPRIVAATNSLQTYINRCLLGFEQSKDGQVIVALDIDEKQEWEWRKNYRVWEANRKIFLFPENYVAPEIRDNKSPEFEELEDELLQQKLNSEVVENAYKKYIQQIMVLAELKIAGAYHDTETNRIYLFGKTNKQPVEYYYRYVEFLENGGTIWSNWEKMNVAIPAQDISAIRYNGKLYVFWTSFQRKDISDVVGGTQTIKMHTYDVYVNYSFLQVDNKWCVPQKIELDYRKSSPFDPFLRIKEYKDKDLVNSPDTNNPSLKPEANEVSENALKEFERTIYRKPYPVKTSDRNILRLDYIWTDKKDALQPIYRNTRAVFDGFTKNVKINVNMPIIGPITFDVDFSFNRFDQVVHVANSANESEAPDSITISSRTIPISLGGDQLYFTFSFDSGGKHYSLRTGNNPSGNPLFTFKEPNKEIASGSVELIHRVDYVPVSKLQYQKNRIKLADQKKISSSNLNNRQAVSLRKEYSTYFDSFNKFSVTNGGTNYADGINDYTIQQNDMVAILTTPALPDPNNGHKLNPDHIQLLWDKVSLSVDDLLDYNTQRQVATQIDYSKSFGNYFFELFFHIPMRIADHLNAAGKYREANQWYSYIYNPTAIKEKFEQLVFPNDVNWRFAAFRNIGIKKLKEIYSDPNAIEMYRRNPGNPHAIARLRIGAYQKNVVMKYLDNLMDWGDYLFEQYTPESTSEARHLYDIVKTILGDKPEKTGNCKETPALAYKDIDVAKNSEFIYNLFGPVNKGPQGKVAANPKPKASGKGNPMVLSAGKTRNSTPFAKVRSSKDPVKNSYLQDKKQGRPTKPQNYFDIDSDLIFCFPNNKDFIAYWDRVNDRIYKLNHCMDLNGVKKQMPAYAPEIDPALLARMVAGGMSFDEIVAAISGQLPNHRFVYLIEKAKQFCGVVQSFGGALFGAIEKRDVEELTLLRTRHEQNILTLTTKNKKRQIDQAKSSMANLLETKANIENRKAHFEGLIEEGLIEWENAEQIAKWTSGSIRTAEGVLQLLAGGLGLLPQLGSPFAMKYGGVELSGSANKFAHALEATAKIADNVAILAGLEGSHQRREEDWKFQLETANFELSAMAEQLRTSEITLAMTEFDLEIHEANIEQYKELYEFYTSKFSDYKHYTFQVQQLQKLYRMAFNLAHDFSMQAQKAFEFERFGNPLAANFIQSDNWTNDRNGLLAGERLMLQLMQMEKEFVDTDERQMEITQHFSMLQIAPDKLYELKETGECTGFSIPEAAFDLSYPGYFRRIIKSVRITIPCIAGPYTNIGATLTLGTTNKIRKDIGSGLIDFAFNGYGKIATSNAQNDGGQFELNFRDERYLPFEGAGAVSNWTLSLPKLKRAFDYNTISDVIMHISYTAEYDGSFKEGVETGLAAALDTINGKGLIRVFSLRHDFPNDWNLLTLPANDTDRILELRPEHFPYFTNTTEIAGIDSISFTIDSTNKLEKKPDSQGIAKESKMKIKIPKALGKTGDKDVIFFVKYKA